MMMQFTMARFTEGNTIFETMSKVHRKKGIDRYNMVNFQFNRITTNLALMFISFKASLLNLKPEITISRPSATTPAWMLISSHFRSLFTLPIGQRMYTEPSSPTSVATKYSFSRTQGMKLLVALLTNCGNRSSSFRLFFAFHSAGIDNTSTRARTILLAIVLAYKRFSTFLASKVVILWHNSIIAHLALVVKKYPNAPELKYEDCLIFRKEVINGRNNDK